MRSILSASLFLILLGGSLACSSSGNFVMRDYLFAAEKVGEHRFEVTFRPKSGDEASIDRAFQERIARLTLDQGDRYFALDDRQMRTIVDIPRPRMSPTTPNPTPAQLPNSPNQDAGVAQGETTRSPDVTRRNVTPGSGRYFVSATVRTFTTAPEGVAVLDAKEILSTAARS